MSKNHRPVILFDLDETVIGSIRPQLYEYFIINYITSKISSKYINFLISDLNKGLLRPYFKDLINYLKTKNVDIFIYTASTKEWAEFIIPVLEKCINYKFCRPIFTRNNMINKKFGLTKSIECIKPILYKTVYNSSLKNVNYEDFNNIVIFDNRVDIIYEKKYLVNNPAYSFIVIVDITRSLSEKQVADNVDTIANIIIQKRISDYKKFKYLLKIKIDAYIKETKIINQRNKYDDYWKKILNKFKTLDLDNISNKQLTFELRTA
jgi:hypothetical protein